MFNFYLWLWEIEIAWKWVEWTRDWPTHEPFIDFDVFINGVEVFGLDPGFCKRIERLCECQKDAEDMMNAADRFDSQNWTRVDELWN